MGTEHSMTFLGKSLLKAKAHLRASQQLGFEIMLNDKHASFLPHHFTSQLLQKQESLLVLAQCYKSNAFPVLPEGGRK